MSWSEFHTSYLVAWCWLTRRPTHSLHDAYDIDRPIAILARAGTQRFAYLVTTQLPFYASRVADGRLERDYIQVRINAFAL